MINRTFSILATLLILSGSAFAQAVKPLRALLVVGGGYHNYTVQKDLLKKGIEERANVTVDIAFTEATGATSTKFDIFSQPDWSKNYDVVIHDECSTDIKDLDYIHGILKPHAEGLPAVVLHCAMHSFRSEGWKQNEPSMTPWFEFTGLQTTGHGDQLPIALTSLDKENSITKGMEEWTTGNEELYNNIAGKVLDTAKPLVRGQQQIVPRAPRRTTPGTNAAAVAVTSTNNAPAPVTRTNTSVVVWTNQYQKGRVFGTTLGHNNATVGDARYLDLVTRGMLWACDKLNDQYLKPAPKKTTSLWLPETVLIAMATRGEIICGIN